ncbi:transaldolase family protein [Phanerochaete sordida]|uniref:Transaldolase family protein n=1 Tax=Phanerochaete sordida TaxID=48140 RepID=A0A9P3G1F4_9APHY|nr:transaldolase family protein [Phanerochaete sordida]
MSALLDQIRASVTLDVDSMDPAVAARHAKAAQFCDMTSNQAIVHTEVAKPERAHIVKAACDRAKSATADPDAQLSTALDLLSVLLAKEVLPSLTGRVHAQTSTALAHDTPATVAHAARLVALFEAEGIPRSRVCIKIPASPAGVLACAELERAGVRTLATCLFNVPQALAAVRAGCAYVAPYFNELRVHFEPSVWRAYDDTLREHPACAVIAAVIKCFRDMGAKTLVMPASIVTVDEALALTALKPDHLTLSGAILDKLAAEPPKDLGAQTITTIDVSDEVLQTDFLANGGEALRIAFEQDAEATRKLADALLIFDEMEQKTKALIRAQLSS